MRRRHDHIGALVALFRGPILNFKLGLDQLLGRHAAFQTLLAGRGVRIALYGGEGEPFVGLGQVVRDAEPALMKDAEIVLAVLEAEFGGIAGTRSPLW